MSVFVVRAFVRLREMAVIHRELAMMLAELEHRFEDHDEKIEAVFDAIRQLMAPTEQNRKRIGF